MNIRDINPHLRFATQLHYEQVYNDQPVKVSDCRIFYIIDGDATLHIGDRDYTLVPNSLFYCCAGSKYTTHTQRGFSLISLNFDLTQGACDRIRPFPPCALPEKWDTLPVLFDSVPESVFLNDHLFLPNADSLRHHLQTIVSEFSAGSRLFREICGSALKTLLLEMHRFHQIQLPPKVLWVRDYIQKHYAEEITNRFLADTVGYHEYYLNRVFTEHTGSSLHGFLLQTRLRHASYLILNTDMELGSIAETVGFRSYPHFSSYFKQTYGYPPAQYRKRLKGSI